MSSMKIAKSFDYRDIWLGIAILWIVFFHSKISVPSSILMSLKNLGYGGVDICLFASGIGCYYSLSKDDDIVRFFRRRLFRIIPTYWCVLIPWTIYVIFTRGIPWPAILGNLFCIQDLTNRGNGFNWYLSVLLILYILAPSMKAIVARINSWKTFLLSTFFLILLSFPFWHSDSYIIIATRIPIFFIGMYFAKLGQSEVGLSKMMIIVSAISLISGLLILKYFTGRFPNYMWSCGLWWYPFILITPGMCLALSALFHFLSFVKSVRILAKILTVVGGYSFEIYLLHIFFFNVLDNYVLARGTVENRNVYWLGTILLILPGCYILRKSQEIIMKFVWPGKSQ